MLVAKRYFLSDLERENVEQMLMDNGHQCQDILHLDDEEIIHIYQKIMVDQLITK
ncbi:hypothetical protein [Sutcliffiella halmapala]|uniref:hypothetical protein n=1 Tax=Sutcliffiella halmapala TaxID=79882 RepID=UPI0014732109|nr:hypothetical protein [Sutcliffiella halmapala]